MDQRTGHAEPAANLLLREPAPAQGEDKGNVGVRQFGTRMSLTFRNAPAIVVLLSRIFGPRHPSQIAGVIIAATPVNVVNGRAKKVARDERQGNEPMNVQAVNPAMAFQVDPGIAARTVVRLPHSTLPQLERLQSPFRRRQIIQAANSSEVGHFQVPFEAGDGEPQFTWARDRFRVLGGVTGYSHGALLSRCGQGRDGDLQAPFRPAFYSRIPSEREAA